jgi:hypothetical protein
VTMKSTRLHRKKRRRLKILPRVDMCYGEQHAARKRSTILWQLQLPENGATFTGCVLLTDLRYSGPSSSLTETVSIHERQEGLLGVRVCLPFTKRLLLSSLRVSHSRLLQKMLSEHLKSASLDFPELRAILSIEKPQFVSIHDRQRCKSVFRNLLVHL